MIFSRLPLYLALSGWGLVPIDGFGGLRGLEVNWTASNDTLTNDTEALALVTDIVEDIQADEEEGEPTEEETIEEEPAEEEETEAPVPVPANDLCADAQMLTIAPRQMDGTYTNSVVASTVGATEPYMPLCDAIPVNSPTLWYKVIGTGGRLDVTTCLPGTELDTRVSVYEGSCAQNTFSCVEANDDAVNPRCQSKEYASRVSWKSEEGKEYFILVHAFYKRVGEFEIAVEPYNDWCPRAEPLALGNTLSGDTTEARFNLRNVLAQCGYTERDYMGEWARGLSQPRGLWYKVVGTGNTFRATTCVGPNPGFYAHRIHVFEDNCNNCMGGMEDPLSCVTHEWDTEAGVDYYVVVHRAYTGYTEEEYPEQDSQGNYLPPQFDDPPPSFPAPFQFTVTELGTDVSVERKQIFD